MAVNTDSAQGNSNGTTDVEMVAAPASGTIRTILSITVYNSDTASATVSIQRKVASSYYVIAKVAMAAGDSLHLDRSDMQSLNATDESIVFDLAGTVTTNELDWTATWVDKT